MLRLIHVIFLARVLPIYFTGNFMLATTNECVAMRARHFNPIGSTASILLPAKMYSFQSFTIIILNSEMIIRIAIDGIHPCLSSTCTHCADRIFITQCPRHHI